MKEGYSKKVFLINGVNVIVYRPILTEQEKLKAEENVKQALRNFGKQLEGEKI